ncbi:hypothetical protein SDC9_184129 [bioreactor metagenome]|uniref:Uncharacterized protein n=1 Tax=bioreactor metagenome TaxID=1076179 RepID=A0A645HEQ7_9ZZZZ
MHQRGISADEIYAAGFGRPVHGQGKGHVVLRVGGSGHHRHGRDGNPLVNDGNAKFPLNVLPGFHQLFRGFRDLIINLLAGPHRVGIAAVQKRNAHGDGADVQMLLIDHFNGGENILLI